MQIPKSGSGTQQKRIYYTQTTLSATLNHKFNIVAHLAWQKGFCHESAAVDDTFLKKQIYYGCPQLG